MILPQSQFWLWSISSILLTDSGYYLWSRACLNRIRKRKEISQERIKINLPACVSCYFSIELQLVELQSSESQPYVC